MKTTQEENKRRREQILSGNTWRTPGTLSDHVLRLLDDADRCAELEETYLRLLTADRDAALARVKELEEGLKEYLDDWSCWDDQVFMNNELRALLNPKDGDR
jgi:hypothetical protein